MFGAQPEIGALDMLMKWAPNAHCHYHRHLAAATTLVLEGAQHTYKLTGAGEANHKIRKAGDYAHSPAGDVHMERAGPQGLRVFFGFQTADGRLFETLVKDRNVPATATVAWYHAVMARRMDYVRTGRTS